MVIETEELDQNNQTQVTLEFTEESVYLDKKGTQELINQLKAYAQQELGATP